MMIMWKRMLNGGRAAPVLALAAIGLLSGCATTPQERAARVQKEVEEMLVVYGPACEKLGYAADTDPYRDCVLRLNNRDRLMYLTRPTTTSCIGHRGFYNCTTF
jgi:hypothetical protein